MITSDILPVGEWLPDQSPYNSSGASEALNVYTDGDKYRPVKDISELSDDLGAQCYGAYDHIAADGTITSFAATRTKIFKLNSTTWEDVTNTGADYATSEDGCWHFTQFGDRVIATNYTDKMQSFLVGTDTDFSDLITSGPDVRCANFGIINNFLVTINVFDSDGATQNRVRWSPINDPAGNYTSSQSTQADFQDVEDGNPGEGMAVISGQNFGILIFKNAIYRMEYVGPPTIFQFSLIEQNRGAVNGQSVASNGRFVFYRGESGFWMFDGNQSVPIGYRKVDRWFDDISDTANIHQIRATMDPLNKNALWAFTTVNSDNARNDEVLVYNWADGKFTHLNVRADVIYRGFTSGANMDNLGYSDLDDLPYSLDSRFWIGGETQLAAVTNNNKLGYFEGDTLEAIIESQEVRLNASGLASFSHLTPVYEGGSVQCRLGSRMLQNDTVLYTPYSDPSTITGNVDFLNTARYHRAGVKLSGEWEQFQGVRLAAKPYDGI